VPSIIGFVLFAWLLAWLLLGEHVTPRTLSGVGVIVVGVTLIVWSGSRSQRTGVAAPKPALELDRCAA